MSAECLACDNWHITRLKNGALVLSDMAKLGFGQCTQAQTAGRFTPKAYRCDTGKFQQASDETMKRRRQAFAKV